MRRSCHGSNTHFSKTGDRGGARTRACRVETRLDTRGRLERSVAAKRRHEWRRGTHECVRHITAESLVAMPDLKLSIVTRTQGNNKALKNGTVKPRTCEFEFVEVDPLIDAFRRMVRGLEFDVCEMAMTTYITARAHGKRVTGLPIFLVRAFHHGAIVYNTRSGIKSPKDLEGRRVGVNRGYTVTTGLWAR